MNFEYQLLRVSHNNKATFGCLVVHGIPLVMTLEPPWLDNQTNVSCIPPGEYTVVKHFSNRFKECLKILGVEGRTDILIHAGNFPKDTKGCVLVGLRFDNKKKVLKDSRKALELFRRSAENEFILNIRDVSLIESETTDIP